MATAPIRPLAWEPLYAAGAAIEKGKKTNKQTNKQKPNNKKNQVLWTEVVFVFDFLKIFECS